VKGSSFENPYRNGISPERKQGREESFAEMCRAGIVIREGDDVRITAVAEVRS